MKIINKISFLKHLWVLLPFIALIGCGSKTSKELISKSPDGQTSIFVNGDKPSFGDPWQTKIKIKTSTDEKEVVTEIFASELDGESVQFTWEANDKCRIIFSQQDETQRNMFIEANAEKITLREE
jgi:hypothetical protein